MKENLKTEKEGKTNKRDGEVFMFSPSTFKYWPVVDTTLCLARSNIRFTHLGNTYLLGPFFINIFSFSVPVSIFHSRFLRNIIENIEYKHRYTGIYAITNT